MIQRHMSAMGLEYREKELRTNLWLYVHVVKGKADHGAHRVVRHIDLGLGRVRDPVRTNLLEDASGDKIPCQADCGRVDDIISTTTQRKE